MLQHHLGGLCLFVFELCFDPMLLGRTLFPRLGSGAREQTLLWVSNRLWITAGGFVVENAGMWAVTTVGVH